MPRSNRYWWGVLLFATITANSHAGDAIAIPTEQRTAMGIEVVSTSKAEQTSGLEISNAKIFLPPASVRVVAAPANGLVTSLSHQAGEYVSAGHKVAVLSSPTVVESQRLFLQARLKHELATHNEERDRHLAEQGLLAKNTWMTTENELKLAKADVEAAKSTLKLLGVKADGETSEITLSAPINGWIVESMVEPGQRVEAPSPLVKIGNLHKLGVEIPLTTEQAKAVQDGQSVVVESGKAKGSVRSIQPAIDQAQNVIVRADVEQEGTELRPGQIVKVKVQTSSASKESVSIPAGALVWDKDKAFVFVENTEGFVPTPVTVVEQGGEKANVTGVASDVKVAVKGVAALKAKWQEAAGGA